MAKKVTADVPKFFDQIAPGGKYFKYSLVVLIILGLALISLVVMITLPLLTGGKFSNPVSRKFFVQPETTEAPKATPAPTLCPNYVIPTGKQLYRYSHGPKVVGPKIQTVEFDPLDPATGQKQTVTITVKNDSPVTSASLTLISDGDETQTAKFKLKEGTEVEGTWELSWQLKDSYKCRYAFKYNLESSTGNFESTQYIR